MSSEVSGVQGGQPQPSPEELERYKKDYNEGLKLFQNAFQEYTKPDVEAHKKAKLQDVMDKALNVMNETACVAISEGKQKKEAELNAHYQAFVDNPTPENQQKVAEDLSALSS